MVLVNLKTAYLAGISICVLAHSNIVRAEGSLAAYTAQSRSLSAIETIEVEGQFLGSLGLRDKSDVSGRLGLSVLETPGSIDIISADAIQLRGDFNAIDAVTRATGITSSATPGNGNSRVTSRGFAGNASVLNLYDGTRLYVGAGTVTFPADTWSLERIEVLRGAASVIHGIGAIGAAVNYVPKRARLDEQSVEGFASAGSFGVKRFAAGANTPITDDIAIRLDGSYFQTNGYIDRSDQERFAFSGSILWQPADNFSVSLRVDYADVEDAPYWGTPKINGELISANRRLNYNVEDGAVEYEDVWPQLRINWQPTENIDVNSDTYYIKADRRWTNLENYRYNPDTDLVDRRFYLEILHDQRQVGNRTAVSYDAKLGDIKNRISVGAEFNDINFTHTNNSPFGGTTSVPVTDFEPGFFVEGALNETTRDYITDTQQFAVFFDDVFEITEQISIVGGVRYDNVSYTREDVARSNGQSAGLFSRDFNNVTWRAGLVYQPSELLSFYAQTSTALDPVSSPVSASATFEEFEPSTGRQYEIGVKQVFWDGRGEWSLAAFHIRKNDILSRDVNDPSIRVQIGEQGSEGIELSLGLRPIDTLAINFNGTLLNAEYKDFTVNSGGTAVSLAGNTPRNVPEQAANLWVTWTPLPEWSVTGGLRYVSDRFADDTNNRELPGYVTVDVNTRWEIRDGVGLIFRVDNLFDKEDVIIAEYSTDQAILADPRAFEFGIDFRF